MSELERELLAVAARMLMTPRHEDVARFTIDVFAARDFGVIKALDGLVDRDLLSRTETSSGYTDRSWVVYRTTAAGRTLGKRLLARAEAGKEVGDG